ncbi:hypothetical protein [Streptomyces sp. RB17]|uniref:hypothetical protein n=1 Tax=Streptomyces sp. RB17 TaxID=2585197 RepID=UPI00129761AC|nr:hypothetical protein [Streptomyces sp. RB17]
MITSNPVGDWTWEVPPGAEGVRLICVAETAVAVWSVLAAHATAAGETAFEADTAWLLRLRVAHGQGLSALHATAAGETAFEADTTWLLRLRVAHGQGLSALTGLSWVAQSPPHPEIGLVVEDAPQEAPSLDALEELSGRY